MRLVTVKIASDFLMVKRSTLYSWAHNGSIPFHKLNGLVRFDLDELEKWVKESKCMNNQIVGSCSSGSGTAIDKLIKNAIDSTKGKAYNLSNGKPGQMQGLRKEV